MFVAALVRAAIYGIYMVWHLVLIFQGSRDMARMPLSTFRYNTCITIVLLQGSIVPTSIENCV